MADFSVTPVGQTIKPPQNMSLGDMVNIARGTQAYRQAEEYNPLVIQQQRQEVEKGGIELNQKRQADKERLNIQMLMQTEPNKIMTDGRFDPDKLNAVIPQIAPYTGDQYITKFTTLGNAQTEARDATQKLDQTQIGRVASVLDTLGYAGEEDPKKYIDHLERLKKNNPNNVDLHKLIDANVTMLKESNAGKHIPQAALMAGQQLLTHETKANIFRPIIATTEGRTTITKPSVLGSQPSSIIGTAGGQQQVKENIVTDAYGNPNVVTTDSSGKIISSRPVPNQQGGFQSLPPGETSETAKSAKDIQIKANNAAMPAQNSLFNNSKIINLADKAFTGVGAETLSKLGGAYAALPWTSNATTNMQILGHQMSLETANLAGQAGLGTDAARSLAEKMAGTTNWTPDAIKQTARMNRALSTGTLLFNEGVNNSVAKANNNPFAAREFQNKWASAPDLIPTLQFIDAVNNKDKQEIKNIIDSLGGPTSKGTQELLQKSQNIRSMIGSR